jgi:hypothetical protein
MRRLALDAEIGLAPPTTKRSQQLGLSLHFCSIDRSPPCSIKERFRTSCGVGPASQHQTRECPSAGAGGVTA